MEYVYAAMLLHKAGKAVDESSIKHVLQAAGIHADDGRIKALVAALEGVNIDDAIKSAAVVVAPAAGAHTEHHGGAKKEEKKKEEEKPSAEEAAAGLGALFG